MRLVQRPNNNPIPERLRIEAQETIDAYYKVGEARQQQRIPLDRAWRASRRELVGALLQLFNRKCAYCESPIGLTSDVEIDQFRPVSASDVDGSGSMEHYQWLRMEWKNLYPACHACNRAKRGLFPVSGPRAEVRTPVEKIADAEKALLLDPCRDNPKAHLEFQASGEVHGMTEQGRLTVKVLNLNRSALVAARRQVWINVTQRLGERIVDPRWVSPDMPYWATAQAAMQAKILENPVITVASETFQSGERSADELLATDKEAYRLTQRPIQSIEITNFKLLRNIKIELPEPVADRAPWLVLIGENASGKSSILQAIALALAGAEEASRLIQAPRVLTRKTNRGEIAIKFWDTDTPVKLGYERGNPLFTGTQRPSATVRAFGALRHMERRRRQTDEKDVPYVDIYEMVRPIARIEYPDRWLRHLSKDDFKVVGTALKQLLPVNADALLEIKGRKLIFRLGDAATPLSQASAGYQTIIGIAVEIIKMVFKFWKTLESASAIVLIDELDAHLHPRWKMRIVSALRTAFPNIQFIASTHDPLLLRGLRNREIALVTRATGTGTVVNTDLPPIEGMQVDEILTSSAFGLDSTIDPETEALFDEYYYLMSRPQSFADQRRISELRDRLADREALGRNARENMMLEAAQQFLRETADRAPLQVDQLRQETVQHMRDMFSDVSLPPRRT